MIADATPMDLETIALRGLRVADCRLQGQLMPFTLRGAPGPTGPRVAPEGHSLRYSAIAALGLGRRPVEVQRAVLGGRDAAWLARACLQAARGSDDGGAVALSVWAAGEVAGTADDDLLVLLLDAVRGASIPTVECAWAVLAGLASPAAGSARLAAEGMALLLTHQNRAGVFPHSLPRAGGVRGHVSCFADQVYPVQALARFAARTGDNRALTAADAAARWLVSLQGAAGQWWWHYDARTGDVVERYPVYSVHQYAMAPMALSELAAAGGRDHDAPVHRGLAWLQTHPECVEPLVAPDLGVVWRKVGRREPPKAARTVAALAGRVSPRISVPGVDRLWPPGRVDYECRPYELGWLLYASAGPVGQGGAR